MRYGRWCWKKHGFKECGVRKTQAREALIELLSQTEGHLTAEEIFWKLKEVLPGIGLATVYRTLELLTQLGLVKKLDFQEGKARFEFIKPEERDHHHLICKNCGKIFNYTPSEEYQTLKELTEKIKKEFGFMVDTLEIQAYGLCKDCQKV
ncbi:transcriptional repressor [Thermodesulfobacterium sp. TA1]|uniref:Fur family transcriptional regulator n=1 Tax=Thermodesulfobacterium sp. TA1 TaxID=2234087 RepID=UPI0012323981|nr:transcriptional repressor [Thermodesulfobacterium sp. TA1]QER41920.1 transcriptional repressor [Thermodesulfobacterium sp. TA1]